MDRLTSSAVQNNWTSRTRKGALRGIFEVRREESQSLKRTTGGWKTPTRKRDKSLSPSLVWSTTIRGSLMNPMNSAPCSFYFNRGGPKNGLMIGYEALAHARLNPPQQTKSELSSPGSWLIFATSRRQLQSWRVVHKPIQVPAWLILFNDLLCSQAFLSRFLPAMPCAMADELAVLL